MPFDLPNHSPQTPTRSETTAEALTAVGDAFKELGKVLVDALTPIIDWIIETFDAFTAGFADLFNGIDWDTMIRFLAVENHGITEADIKRVNVDDRSVTLWNHRRIEVLHDR